MKMFSDCSGSCEECITHYTGGCLAGHGDDDFVQITEKEAKEILEMFKYRLKFGIDGVDGEWYEKHGRHNDIHHIDMIREKFPNLE